MDVGSDAVRKLPGSPPAASRSWVLEARAHAQALYERNAAEEAIAPTDQRQESSSERRERLALWRARRDQKQTATSAAPDTRRLPPPAFAVTADERRSTSEDLVFSTDDSAAAASSGAAASTREDLVFSADDNGDEIILLPEGARPSQGHTGVVMMAWEREYMMACVAALDVAPSDRVLEIGFGLGYSSTAIQSRAPAQHVIIECSPAVLCRASSWASGRSGVTIVAARWQDAVATLGTFDCVFFDDFPMPDEDADGASRPSESRWRALLTSLIPLHVKQGARVSGYCASASALGPSAKLPRSCSVSLRAFDGAPPPPHCPYLCEHDRLFVPLVTITD